MPAQTSACALGIVDNDPLSLTILSSYIVKQIPSITLAWSTSDPRKALNLCMHTSISILLTDMSMSDIDGLTLIRRIRQRDRQLTIIAMTSFPLQDYAEDAATAGAQTIISKRYPERIIATIRDAAAGKSIIPSSANADFRTAKDAHHRIITAKPTGIDRLNKLEQRITELSRQGLTSSEIGEQINMSATTVSTHLKRACEKAGARNRVQLVAMWIEHNLPRR
jgi:DNA-binding NarL/FixJ family response regulator